jgi:hypothetical protein
MIYLAPMLPAFRALYPKFSVQTITANRYPDFIEAGDAKERVSRVVGRASGPSYSSQVHVGCDAC